MNDNDKRLQDFFVRFLSIFLCRQDKTAALALLCDNICWTLGNNGKIANGLQEAEAMLESFYLKYSPVSSIAELFFNSEQVSAGKIYICGQYELLYEEKGSSETNGRLNLTAICVLDELGEYRLAKIHNTFINLERSSEKAARKTQVSVRKSVPEKLEQQKQDLLIAYVELKKQNEELIKKNKKLVELTTMDLVTRTFNQDAILGFVLAEMDRFSRYGHIFSLIALSIGSNNEPNGLSGSIIGNLILKNAALIIKKQLRKNDRLGRYLGDRFLLVLPNTELEGAKNTARRIMSIVEKLSHKKYNGNVTLSMGICEYSKLSSIEQLVANTEQQLEAAIKNGRNCICASSEIL